MKRGLLYCFVMLLGVSAGAQWNSDVQKVWSPDSGTITADDLAGQIQLRYQSKEDRLRAAYNWVTSNIRYSTDSAYYFDQAVTHEEKIASVLRRRKGVCEHYASLFAELAQKMDIPAYVVHGLVKIGGNTAHSWVAVQLNEKWYLCDPTWDAVQRPELVYYKGSPLFFSQTHLPFDPIWQLLEEPIGYKPPGKKAAFNYNDSIKTFFAQDSLQRFISIERRMKQMHINRSLYKTWQSYNRMKIAIIAGEEDMRLYNAAVEELNKAKEVFNNFIHYRNNRFLPEKSDEAIAQMLHPVKRLIDNARLHIAGIGQITENYQYNTESLSRQLEALEKRTHEQLLFLKEYFAALGTEREKFFLVK